jgi:hypothetical protein
VGHTANKKKHAPRACAFSARRGVAAERQSVVVLVPVQALTRCMLACGSPPLFSASDQQQSLHAADMLLFSKKEKKSHWEAGSLFCPDGPWISPDFLNESSRLPRPCSIHPGASSKSSAHVIPMMPLYMHMNGREARQAGRIFFASSPYRPHYSRSKQASATCALPPSSFVRPVRINVRIYACIIRVCKLGSVIRSRVSLRLPRFS